jgi:Tfp pilus assembly protein PilO
MKNLTTKQKWIVAAIALVVLGIGGYLIWAHMHPPQLATGESQQQAETSQGVEQAAHNAHVKMYQDQIDEAARQIAMLKNQKPDTIIKTVPIEVEKTVIKEVEKRGADFAIVTDPKQPDQKVDLKEVAKLPASTPVELNQYNVYAYKKVIRGVNIYPKFNGLTPYGVSEVTVDVSRKINKDGKYIGAIGGYDFDDKKIKAGIRFSY